MRYGIRPFARLCFIRCPVVVRPRQMWFLSRAQNSLVWLNSLSRPRKLIICFIVLLTLTYYLLPSIFKLSRNTIQAAENCMENKIHGVFYKSLESLDSVVNHNPLQPGEKLYPMYVGNGKIAASFDSEIGMFIRLNKALSVPVKFFPIVNVAFDDKNIQEAYVLNMRSGIAHNIKTLNKKSECIVAHSSIYAHRSRPSLFVQDIQIYNPSSYPVVLELDQAGPSGWKNARTEQFRVKHLSGGSIGYKVTTGLIKLSESGLFIGAAFAWNFIDENTISIKGEANREYHLLTVVHYTVPLRSSSDATNNLLELTKFVKDDMEFALSIDHKLLEQQHTKVWSQLWLSGFSISHSHAGGVLNGEKINMTLYYVLSNVPAPLHDPSTTSAHKTDILKVLYYPDQCYGDHSTLLAEKLWIDVVDEDQIARVVTTWMITLETYGCKVMVQSGAEGVLQAMLLSFGALRFRENHLEFVVHPKELHRDISFHRINYGNNTHVNISVYLGEDNKANLYVSLDRNDKPYYACDAGCLDAPVHLSKDWSQLPVKMTEPMTAILYITDNKQHILDLKKVIHVKGVVEAPAHEHHVISLHKHGHNFGGLPMLFWISIAFLIIIFHLFLFKLICNEYCSEQTHHASSSSSSSRSHYNYNV